MYSSPPACIVVESMWKQNFGSVIYELLSQPLYLVSQSFRFLICQMGIQPNLKDFMGIKMNPSGKGLNHA